MEIYHVCVPLTIHLRWKISWTARSVQNCFILTADELFSSDHVNVCVCGGGGGVCVCVCGGGGGAFCFVEALWCFDISFPGPGVTFLLTKFSWTNSGLKHVYVIVST